MVIGRVLLSLRTVNKPLDLVGGKQNSATSNKYESMRHTHMHLSSLDRQADLDKNTHPLVDFRVPSAAVGNSVLNNSACKCAAAF